MRVTPRGRSGSVVIGIHAFAPSWAGVRWLRDSLNTAHGRTKDGNCSDYYDEELVRMVEEFQRQHRLNVDGIAGVQTQIVLDTVTNANRAPLLVAQAQDSPGAS